MKYKYVVFSPYFGKLPNNINLWIKSCSYNNNFKFIVFTDDSVNIKLPSNVIFIKMTFEEFRDKIQSKFDFKISLDAPYKLCDFRPAFGYIFEDYLDGCDYWGECDLDMIFGDLNKYMPKDSFDKISFRGHLMLIKNTENLKKAFMLENTSKINYVDIFSNPMHFACDEIGDYGINNILKKNGYSIYHFEKTIADISTKRVNLRVGPIKQDDRKIKRVFSFENGKIFSYDLRFDKVEIKEYSYIHFQKRKMSINLDDCYPNKFIITYNSFENYEDINKDFIINHQPNIKINGAVFKIKYNSFKKKIKRNNLIKKIKKRKIR